MTIENSSFSAHLDVLHTRYRLVHSEAKLGGMKGIDARRKILAGEIVYNFKTLYLTLDL